MKNLIASALVALALPAAAQQAASSKVVLSSKVTADAEFYVVADKALAKIVFSRDQVCAQAAKAKAAWDAAYGSVSPADAELDDLEQMLADLRRVKALQASCDQSDKAAAARVDTLLGAGSGARLKSSSAFEGKVSLALTRPVPPKNDDAATWKMIEEGWKHGNACP